MKSLYKQNDIIDNDLSKLKKEIEYAQNKAFLLQEKIDNIKSDECFDMDLPDSVIGVLREAGIF